MPAPLVLVVVTVPVSMRVAVTSTSGTTRPFGSCMTPLSVAVSICANAGTPTSKKRTTSVRTDLTRRVVDMVPPLPVYAHEGIGFVPAHCVKELLKPYSEEPPPHSVRHGWFGG